jgi:2,5-diketo-D-gluconate reductase A
MNSRADTLTGPQSTVAVRGGTAMPVLGLGTWQLLRDTAGTVAHALSLGYRMIDTSGDYGTQPEIGEAIRGSGAHRHELYLVSKVEETDDAYRAALSHLAELQLEAVDLLLIHRPPPSGAGVELWQGLIRAKRDGLTREIGVSNYGTGQIRELAEATGEMPAVNQIEWSPFGHSAGMRRFCREQGIVLQAYSPLTRGRRLRDPALLRVAEHCGRTPAQVLIRWNLQQGTVPVPKANDRNHLAENLAVFDFEIDEDDMDALGALNERYSALGELPYE